jgi:hypothetical protein
MRVPHIAVIACSTFLALNSFGDPWDKKTLLTVWEPLLIPGKTLEPGQYVLKLVDSLSDRHIVQILNILRHSGRGSIRVIISVRSLRIRRD